jgi:hypothetical protein
MAALVLDVSKERVTVGRVWSALEEGACLGFRLVERPQAPVDAKPDLRHLGPGHEGQQRRRLALDLDRLRQEPRGPLERVSSHSSDFLSCLQVELERPNVRDGTLREAPVFVGRQGDVEGADDLPRHAFLHLEDVVDRAAVLVGPEVGIGQRVDQLGSDSEAVAGFPDASFEDVAHAEIAANRPHVLLRALQLHRGRSGDDTQRLDLREVRDDLLGEPVAEVLVVRVGAQVCEREDDDRAPIRWSGVRAVR